MRFIRLIPILRDTQLRMSSVQIWGIAPPPYKTCFVYIYIVHPSEPFRQNATLSNLRAYTPDSS